MVGRASVTREPGSPATLPDLSSINSRRSSSRASQRTAPAPELNTSNLTQSSYSLPPTPLASSFDEFLPSAKRRRTQRAVCSEDKTLPSVTETPTHRAFSEPFQVPKSRSSSARPARTSNLAQSNTQSSQEQDAPLSEADPGSPSSSKSNPPLTSEQPQGDQQTITPRQLLSRQETITVKADPDKDIPAESPAAMGAAMSHSRKTRKSKPAGLDGCANQENGTTPSKASSRASTPQSSRRDRKSRLAANTGAKITKPPPASKVQSPVKAQAQDNGATASATPAKQPSSATPNTSTRSRRHRKSTRATNDQTPISNEKTGHSALMLTHESTHSQSPKRSNTVTLNVGRKSLESIIAQQKSHDQLAGVDTPGHIENGAYHFDYDTEMYRNNYGLDGHMDPPTSPTSLSTTASTAARTSGRTRKPTIRALESIESEKRHRRSRAASAKPAAATAETTAGITSSKQKPPHQSPTSGPETPRKPRVDVMIIAKQIYELAAAAVAPDFVSAPEVDIWLKELQQKVDDKAKQKEVATSPFPEREAEDAGEAEEAEKAQEMEIEREDTPPSNKAFQDNVQASKPWTDRDGWKYTGQINKHGEEYVIVPPDFEWYRPNNTYGDNELPLPPVRIRSSVQSEKDRALGYPPCIGERNVPVDNQGFFLFENVLDERTKLKVREAARERGIFVTRFMSIEEMETMINLYDNGQPPVLPAAPVPEDDSVKAKEPSRKRRRTDNTSDSKPSESADVPKLKRRRQEADNPSPPEPTPPEPSAEDDPNSERRSLKITLTFGNKRFLLEQAAPEDTNGTDHSGEGPDSNIKNSTSKTHNQTVEKTATENTAPSTPAKATDKAEMPTPAQVTPDSADHSPAETTTGGRPRRRAADALMAGFQRHAEDRARRAERARRGHARRKGTPLKTVTGIHGDTVESPIRPAVNPMNLD
ncbi:hypothetical protein BDW62DRAFT_54665 [Aspergillus aurantiobrunneus]